MTQQSIDFGTADVRNDGETIFAAFTKIQTNFTELYAATPVDGTLTLAPTDLTSNRGISITQRNSATSAAAPGGPGVDYDYNRILINRDRLAEPANSIFGFRVIHNTSGGLTSGQRAALAGHIIISAADDPTNPLPIFAGAAGIAQASSSMNGTDTGSGARGRLIGTNPNSILASGATNWFSNDGVEINTAIRTGASSRIHAGILVAQYDDHAVSGAELDAGLRFANQSGAVGWEDYGIVFDANTSGVGTLFKSTAKVIATIGSVSIAGGIDFTSATFSGNAFASTGFTVTGAGIIITGHTASIAASATQTPKMQVHATDGTASSSSARWSADTSGSQVFLLKSRGAAVGTRGVVSSGDTVGTLGFNADDGTNFIPAAAVRAAVDGAPGTNDMPGRLLFLTTPDGSASLSERMRIDSLGNVIINTAAIATTATDGFLHVPSCAGTPTGVPTAYSGRVPVVVDTTNNKLYFYSGGSWRDAGP